MMNHAISSFYFYTSICAFIIDTWQLMEQTGGCYGNSNVLYYLRKKISEYIIYSEKWHLCLSCVVLFQFSTPINNLTFSCPKKANIHSSKIKPCKNPTVWTASIAKVIVKVSLCHCRYPYKALSLFTKLATETGEGHQSHRFVCLHQH